MKATAILLVVLSFQAQSLVCSQDQFDKILETTVSLNAMDLRLVDCLEDVCNQANAPLKYDAELIRNAGVDMQMLVTIELRDVSLSQAIGKLLQVNSKNTSVLRGVWKGNVELTSFEVFMNRRKEMTPDWFGKHTPDFDSEGRIKVVRLYSFHDDAFLDKVLSLPAIKEIQISNGDELTIQSFERIASCPTLLKFSMHQCGLPANEKANWTSDEAIEAIAKSATIEDLRAENCGISDDAMEFLVQMPSLRKLNLRQNQLTDAALLTLAKSIDLTSLSLGCSVYSPNYGKNNFTNQGVMELAGLRKLEGLGLGGTDVSDLDLDLPNLRWLNIGTFSDKPQVTDETMSKLTRYKKLRSLTIRSSLVTNDGIAFAAELPELSSVDIQCEQVTGKGIFSLSGLPLTRVAIGKVRMTDLGLKGLAKIKSLNSISIRGGMSKTTIHGFQLLKALPNLASLRLTGFNGEGDYIGFGELTQLRSLSFEAADTTKLTQEKLNQLGEALPDTRIFAGNGARIIQPQR